MSDSGTPRFQTLEDDAVKLRPLQPPDVDITTAWRNDPAIRDQVLSFRFPVTHQMETRFIDRAIAGDGIDQCVAGIVDRSDEVLCGLVYLRDIDWISRHANFGIMIGRRDRQGRRLGLRAMRLMLGHGFRVLNLERIYLYVVDYNGPAKRLYLSYGFIPEGRLRDHVALDGGYHDLLVMGLLRDEYEASEKRLTTGGT
jgi:RimJ/RimL family protein N-acetyltransferase